MMMMMMITMIDININNHNTQPRTIRRTRVLNVGQCHPGRRSSLPASTAHAVRLLLWGQQAAATAAGSAADRSS